MGFMLRSARGLLSHLWWQLGILENQLLEWRLRAIRAARLALRSTLSMRKDFLVLNSGGAYLPGLFSELGAVLGMLEHYEKWHHQYAGVRVDFEAQGLYYDPAVGANWWEYYFAPIHIGSEAGAETRTIDTDEHVHFSMRCSTKITREHGYRLISRYVRVKPHVREKIDTFVRAYFAGAFVIGIHYRGTDKYEEAPRIPYEDVRAALDAEVGAVGVDRFQLFVASDEQAFVDYLRNFFPYNLTCWSTDRSVDGTPNWVDNGRSEERRVGKECRL